MRRTHGTRQGTRTIASRSKKERGRLFIRRVMHPYEIGDNVSIVIDGGQQKGMPHRRFQGRTGTISGKQGRAYVVSVKDGNKAKTVVSRPEHLRPAE
ncbi:MAG: 50S ribosomal protein L21e [Euryarchaeota archaeon]|nr:50S ribosomal protein L21e [Euryarchaeota archaeon]